MNNRESYIGKWKNNIDNLDKDLDPDYKYVDSNNLSNKDLINNIKHSCSNIDDNGIIDKNTNDYQQYKQSFLYDKVDENKKNLASYLWYYATGRLDISSNQIEPSNKTYNIFNVNKEDINNNFFKLNYLTKKFLNKKITTQSTNNWKTFQN